MSEYQQHMSNKIGLKAYHKDLLSKLLNNMAFDKVDYTNFFRSLGNLKAGPGTSDDELIAPLKNALLDLSKERRKVWLDWLHQYIKLVSHNMFSPPNFVLFYLILAGQLNNSLCSNKKTEFMCNVCSGSWWLRVYQNLRGKRK